MAEDTFDWNSVVEFLNNPSQRWIQAYEYLTESERLLLVCLLDAGDKATVDELQAIYEVRRQLLGNSLSFATCLSRLEHSFLATAEDYHGKRRADFQHPSLRDMVLTQLSDSPNQRLRYISLASPQAVARIIVALRENSRDLSGGARFLLIRTPDEQEALQSRVQELCSQPLSLDQWQELLTAVDRIIPSKLVKREHALPWMITEYPAKLDPAEVRRSPFRESPAAQIAEVVLRHLAKQKTYEDNTRFDLDQWMFLAEKYYDLILFFDVLPLEFAKDLAERCLSSDFEPRSRYLSILARAEPLVVRQVVSREARREWDSELRARGDHLLKEGTVILDECPVPVMRGWPGGEFEDWEEKPGGLDVFAAGAAIRDWRERAEGLLETFEYLSWLYNEVPKEISELRFMVENPDFPDLPDEREYEPDPPERDGSGSYWTIDNIFADL